MAVNLHIPAESDIFPIAGVEIGVAEAGIRYAKRRDLTVFRLAAGSHVAGVFTRNRFCAAPVQVCQRHLAASSDIRALVINTGNANAGTGTDGLLHAEQSCAALADAATGAAVFHRRHHGTASRGPLDCRAACRDC